jgi:hypothetical protein
MPGRPPHDDTLRRQVMGSGTSDKTKGDARSAAGDIENAGNKRKKSAKDVANH